MSASFAVVFGKTPAPSDAPGGDFSSFLAEFPFEHAA